jgi:hypothetical protein
MRKGAHNNCAAVITAQAATHLLLRDLRSCGSTAARTPKTAPLLLLAIVF